MLLQSAKGHPAGALILRALSSVHAFRSVARSLNPLAESRPDAHPSTDLPASFQSLSGQAASSATQSSNQHVSYSCKAASPSSPATAGTKLTHIDSAGQAAMVDVGIKADTQRSATASGTVYLGHEVFELVRADRMKKGDVLRVAQLAGIMGAKQTSLLVPLCHNIPLNKISVKLSLDVSTTAVDIQAEACTFGKTGVEMEALTAVSIAALTVYDMCKAASKDICITDIKLQAKSGGQSGDYSRDNS